MPPDEGVGPPSLWRHPGFVKLWVGETVSVFGTQVTLLAMPLVALKLLHATTFEVGLLVTLERLPFLVIGLPAGAIIDRLRKRPVLVAGDLGRALALGSVPVAYWAGALTIGQVYAVVFVAGMLTVLFDVAYQSYLPALVERTQLVEANAKLQASESAAQVGGPALAGYLYQFLAAGAIVVDALSYLFSAACVLLIRAAEPRPVAHLDESLRHQVADGVRYVFGHRFLRSIAATTAVANFFNSMLLAVYLTYAVRRLLLSPGTIGLIFAVASVGGLLGALVARPLARRLGVGPTIVGAAATFGPPALLVPLAPRAAPVPFLIVANFVLALGATIYNVTQVSLRQALCPPRMQGRMNATMRFLVWGTIPVGSLLGAILGTTLGLRTTLFIAAAGGLFAFLPVACSPVWSIRTVPDPEGE